MLSSFHSEDIGRLSLLVFTETFFDNYQLHDIPLPQLPLPDTRCWICIVATDNQG